MSPSASSSEDLLEQTAFRAPTGDGWNLAMKRMRHRTLHDPTRPPVLIVHGFGMNSFIFGYHPRGTSMVRVLAETGLEVWTMDLRGVGQTQKSRRKPGALSLMAYASIDIPTGIAMVLAKTQSKADQVDIIGASLGGSVAFAHLALNDLSPVRALVCMGSPLTWREAHPALRLMGMASGIIGRVPFRGTRAAAKVLLPILGRMPGLMSIYMNTAHVDMAKSGQLVRSVEDPDPGVNAEIARWVRKKRLIVDGVDIAAALSKQERPLLAVIANRDGIVPASAARSALDAWGGPAAEVPVGGDAQWYAHADLFIGNDAPADVFHPIARWLSDPIEPEPISRVVTVR